MPASFSVLIIEMSHYDEEHERVVSGFPSMELAKEFARRWVRDSLEEFRTSNQTKEDLRRLWFVFGEDAMVIGADPHYAGFHELDYFIEHPATEEERDWKAVKRLAGIE